MVGFNFGPLQGGMVKEAEEFREQDEAYAQKVEARNSFESYVYSLKNSMSEGGVKEAMSEEDRTTLTEKIFETMTVERKTLPARRSELLDSVGKRSAGRAVGRVARVVCVRGDEWPRFGAYRSHRDIVK